VTALKEGAQSEADGWSLEVLWMAVRKGLVEGSGVVAHLPFRTSFTAQIPRTPNMRFCGIGKCIAILSLL
jgi:hypothetical protein